MAKNYDLRREVKANATISTDGLATEVTLQGVKDNTDKLQFLDGKLLVDAGLDETSSLAFESSIGQSDSSIQILDSDVNRKELFIRNDSDSDMYISYTDTAANTSVLKLSKDDVLYENKYKGVISAIWSALGSGFARILDITTTINSLNLINGLNLWLDSNDITTINKKNAATTTSVAFGDYLSFSESITAGSDYSVSGWIKIDDNTKILHLFQGFLTAGNSIDISINNTAIRVTLYGSTSGSEYYEKTAIINSSTWYYVTVTLSNNVPRVYLNGIEQTLTLTNVSFTGSYKNIDEVRTLGTDSTSYEDNISYHSRKLTLLDHIYLYNSGNGIDYENIGNVTKPNYGALFSGTFTDFLNNNTITQFNANDNWSVSFWVNTSTGVLNSALRGYLTATNSISFKLDSLGARLLYFGSTSGYRQIVFDNFISGSDNWYYVTLSSTGATPTLFVNGSQININSDTDFSFTGSYKNVDEIAFGIEGSENIIYQNYAYYSKNLSLSEHQDLYNSGNGLEYSQLTTAQKTDLTSWWSLNETTGTRVDSHSTNNLTENGSVGFDEGVVGTQEVSMTTDLTAWWDMNEISGTRYDLHSTNDLTENGTVGISLGKVSGEPNYGDYVFSWIDKSSNNYIFNQSTGANQPIYNASGFGLNNRASLDFRNAAFLDIVSGSLSSSSTFTVFTVMKKSTASGVIGGLMNSNTDDTYTYLDNADGTIKAQTNIGYQTAATGGNNLNAVIGVTVYDGFEIILYKNEDLLSTTFTANVKSGDFNSIGSATKLPNGDILEVAYYNRVLTDFERLQVTQYLNNKYAIYE